MRGQLGKAIDRLGSTGRILMLVIALSTVGAVFYLVVSARPAAYVTAFSNLDPQAAGEIEAALADAQVAAKITDAGRSVQVPSSQIEAARVAIASSDIAIDGHEGWSLLDRQSLSTTSEQQQINFQRAVAGNLATAIERIQGVRKANVNLALPKDTVFTSDQKQPTASVQVFTGDGVMAEETVRGIGRLVAGAVPGLTAQNVVITNDRGELLSSADAGIGEAAAGRLTAEAAWNRRKTAQAQALLDTILGPGKSAVVVTGSLNFDKVSSKRQEFDGKGIALTGEEEKETLKAGAAGPGGAAGTPTNVPGAEAADEAAAAGNDYEHTKERATNGVNTTVTESVRAGGAPDKISVALTLDEKALEPTGLTEEALESQVSAAIGLVADRDTIETSTTRQLADTAAALERVGVVSGGGSTASTDPLTGMLGPFGVYLKPALATIGLVVLLFLVRRSLRKRQALLSTTDASWLPALEAPPIRVEELMPAMGGPSEAEIEGHRKKQLQGRIEDLAQNRPSEVANQLRGWLAADA